MSVAASMRTRQKTPLAVNSGTLAEAAPPTPSPCPPRASPPGETMPISCSSLSARCSQSDACESSSPVPAWTSTLSRLVQYMRTKEVRPAATPGMPMRPAKLTNVSPRSSARSTCE